MKDMTQGRVASHVLQLAAFIVLTTTFQTLYFLADLYFVGRLGREAVAGVSLSGNLAFLVLALTQALGVGATALVSQALGRRDRERAELLFNQASVATVALQMLANLWLLQREFGRRLRDAPEPALAAGPA
jgi:Na+-driven multidrug efflux pump